MTQTEQTTNTFKALGVEERLLSILSKKGFESPTPIQHQVIPGALEGKDVIGIAQTGTGKTLAFGIPIINTIIKNKGQALILVPTRELALQVEEALRQIANPLGLRCVSVIGGVPQYRQAKGLRSNPDIIIATPGRLDDLMKQRIYTLDRVKIITLDEADRMLDIGFLPQIKNILQTAPAEHQTMLFSATMPKTISSLASAFMKLPLRIEIAPQGTSAENVEHEVFVVTNDTKMRLLQSLLEEYKTDTILIFSRTKHGAKRIARDIREMGHTATEIHSNRSQSQRKESLDGFSRGKFRIMVATDIAARGIDVKQISLVINFDLPESSEDYVHRIGRTGRAGRSGKAISFVTTSQRANVYRIERLIRKSLPLLSHPSIPEVKNRPYESPRERTRPSFGGNRNARGRSAGPKQRNRTRFSPYNDRGRTPAGRSNRQQRNIGRPGKPSRPTGSRS